ncbi:hypothetical protein N7447_009995 [Penicillium robsamsonii]|uniref:uncharacterized protein n=1 Tax=Penicillium robsamsonii TaxID=1792511 RepID=UPI002546DC83|nr:uncharacterized protein N7447_009995 [Penicillium robsamsonii]KAJ5812972.1 hypothetical protein N7447_009995 [Penicillium robsamsonii]
MSLRRFFKKARQRASLEAESQPQETTLITTEGPSGSSIPVLLPPAESSQLVPAPLSPRRIRYLNIIRQYFPLPRRRNSELADRHAGLESRPQMSEFDSHQVSLDVVMPHFELAGRHGGLGFRPQMRGFIGGLLERHLQHQMNRHLGNEIASHQDRNSRADVEHDNAQHSYEPAIPMEFPLCNTEAEGAQLDLAMMREFEDAFALYEASNSQADVEDHDPQNAHGFTMPQTFPPQNDKIEGHSLLRPTPRMQIRAAGPVPSHSGNIPYYSTSDDDNNEPRGRENSDDNPSSDRGSQVRRGRSLRRSGSPFSDVFPALQGSNYPSRDPSQVHRGRTLLRASSLVNDPWVALWGPISLPNDQIFQEPCGITTRRASNVGGDSASDSGSQESRGRTLRRASSVVNNSAIGPVSQAPHNKTQRRASNVVNDLASGPVSWEPRGRAPRRALSLGGDSASDSISQEPHDRTLRRASSVVNDPGSEPVAQELRSTTPQRGSSRASEPCTELWDSLYRMGDPHAHAPRGASPVSDIFSMMISTACKSLTSSSKFEELFASSEEMEQTNVMVGRWVEEVQQAREEDSEPLRPDHGPGGGERHH